MEKQPEILATAPELHGSSVFPNWEELLAAYSQESDPLANLSLAEQGQSYWEELFHKMNFAGMDLMAVYHMPAQRNRLLEEHQRLRYLTEDFAKHLAAEYTNDLRAAGIPEEGIFYMRKGFLPENTAVHLKYPLFYGGTIHFDNLVLIQSKPFHELIHLYLDKQLVGPQGLLTPPRLYVPVPTGKIYVPTGIWTGSGGKNKQDRSVYAGYSQAAWNEIALKNMPGR